MSCQATLQKLQDVDSARTWLDALRQSAMGQEGYVVVMSRPDAWNIKLDMGGFRPETLSLLRELRARWDPAIILKSELLDL